MTSAGESGVVMETHAVHYYDYGEFTEPLVSGKNMSQDALKLFCSFGYDSHKRSNLHYVDDHTILSAVGNILIHPSKKYIAVGEVFPNSPLIYIFEYPGMKLFKVLKGGAVRGFADLAFNSNGDKLASLGSDPDYMLTLWDWNAEMVVLRSKAFSQDVFKVAFAPENDGDLTTSGMGHIKFWKMAATFTGLKLQGYIGKFGASELTDISAFIQLADGKVLSSTETGNMLLWDGGMIKCELALKGKKPCHAGKIEVILLQEGEVFTAGEDGYVRVWDLETIDTADASTVSTSNAEGQKDSSQAAPVSSTAPPQARVFELEILEEFLIGKDVKIKNMIKCPGDNSEYLIQDLQGHLFKLDTKKRSSERIISYHSGSIAAIDASPLGHSLLSLGADGTLRLYDYLTKSTIIRAKYPNNGSALMYLPDTLDARGCTVAAGFSDGVLRIISHTPISLSASMGDFMLHYVFKPHRQPITNINQSSKSTKEYSEDDSAPAVLFSRATISIKPIGFLEFQSPVVSISFSSDNHLNIAEMEPREARQNSRGGRDANEDEEEEIEDIEGRRTLVVTKEGELFSLVVPTPAQVQTRSSFELSANQTQLKQWILDVPVPKAAKDQKAETADEKNEKENVESNDATEVENQDKKDRSTSAMRRKRGLLISNNSPATAVMYLEGGYFMLALVNSAGEGEIRSCKFQTPSASRLIVVHKSPFSDLRLSTSGKYLLVGSVDGISCLRKIRLEDLVLYKWEHGHETYDHQSQVFEEELALKKAQRDAVTHEGGDETEQLGGMAEDEGLQWIGFSHDCDRGRVNSVVTTFDDSFLCTCANDGGLFVWRVNKEPIKRPEAIDDVDEGPVETVDDIVENSVYTMQEEKIKAEKDREIEEAERKKQSTRDYIEELRQDFVRTVSELEKTFPNEAEKMKKEVQVDPNLVTDIAHETELKVQMVRKELEWISEKESIGPNKLKRKFFDDLETEYIEVLGFKSKVSVATFRTTKLEQTLESLINPFVTNEKSQAKTGKDPGGKELLPVHAKKGRQAMENDDKKEDIQKKTQKNDSKSKLEARKALRVERSQLWKELMEAKPDDSYEDPRDVAAIRYAELHMGDYKLKTGEKYIVPESERAFNRRVLRMRQRKKDLVGKISEKNEHIRKISELLNEMGEATEDRIWSPEVDAKSYPHLRYEVKPEDIAKLQAEEAEASQKAKGGGGGGFDMGGFGSSAPAPAPPPVVQAPLPANPAKESTALGSRPGSSNVALTKGSATPSVVKPGSLEPALSNLEIMEREITKKMLKHQKAMVIKEIEDSVTQFDSDIDNLNIKFSDIKLLLLYREWMLLKEFEKHDNHLADKLVTKKNEKADIDAKIKECQEKLMAKKLEIEEVIHQEKAIQEEFHKTLGENNKHEEYLTKIFKKKIKRAKVEIM
ncbi:Cilia- and flagella-associated protein 44 [Phlyctochytrium bullatum]|nr:Cilia- and flagella-associated protein 44 [Phlyctochytrium bullatum]